MALRYKVPQDVQREDTILFFITMKQLVVLMVTGGISYLLFLQLSEIFILGQLEMVLISLPFVFGCAFCFIKVKGINLTQFVLLTIEQGLLPGRRYWQEGSQPVVSSTVDFSTKTKKDEVAVVSKNVSSDKFKNLADLIDNGGKESRTND